MATSPPSIGLLGGGTGPPYAFNNSRNGLEDTLGVIAAPSVSDMDLLDDAVVAVALDGDKEKSANAQFDVKRLGGKRSRSGPCSLRYFQLVSLSTISVPVLKERTIWAED